MCGIVAILKSVNNPCSANVLHLMRDEVTYRGPDDQGSTFFRRCGSISAALFPEDAGWEVGLGHRRLSILDLSPTGHQPMVYRDKFWTVYNGEIYNYLELRSELEGLGHIFCSSSDTEVVLAAYAEWGPNCFSRFRGMWGLVLVDWFRRELIISRDRLGIKPVYLWKGVGIVAVASEIKQFRHLPGFEARLGSQAAAEYLQTGYEDSTRSLFQGVEPVPPGSWIRIPLNTLKPSAPQEYWHPERIRVSVTNAEEAGQLFLNKAQECVRIHLRSDVPVGCALSGGLDSSSIALLMNGSTHDHGSPFHTFTVTFPKDPTDEREFADSVLEKIHALPHYVTPNPTGFLDDLDRFVWIHDEPVGSFAMYAGYCLARLTQQWKVPVMLNGQGGDEVFSGYWQTYFLHLRDLLRGGHWLKFLGHFAGAVVGSGNPALINQVPLMLRRYRARKKPPLRVKIHAQELLNRGEVLKRILDMTAQERRVHEIRVMFLPQLLKWDDRNAMAFSIESRYPLLDHELIELCLSFAPQTLFKYGWTKYPLRLGLSSLLPPKIKERRSKFGFLTPQDKWLCGTLRPKIETWLRSDRPVWDCLERKDVRALAERTWECQGKIDETCKDLFRIFVFDRWLDIFGVQS